MKRPEKENYKILGEDELRDRHLYQRYDERIIPGRNVITLKRRRPLFPPSKDQRRSKSGTGSREEQNKNKN